MKIKATNANNNYSEIDYPTFSNVNGGYRYADDYSQYATATSGLIKSLSDLFNPPKNTTTTSPQSPKPTPPVNNQPPTNNPPPPEKKGLSTGAWIGISLGGVALIGGIAFLIYRMRR